MLITRLGAVASQQPLPMIDAEHAASVGGLSMAANVDPTLSATYAASVDGLTFGASLDDHEIAMFAANVEGLTFAANVAPIVGVSHAANVGGLVFGASVERGDPILSTANLHTYYNANFGVFQSSGGAVSNAGDPVGFWDARGGTAIDASQTTSAARPTLTALNSQPSLSFDGGDFLTAGSVGNWNFLHNSTGFTAVIVFAKSVSNPGTSQSMIDTGGVSSVNIGLSIFYDDRSIVPADDRLRVYIGRGVSGQSLQDRQSANGVLSGTGPHLIVVRFNGVSTLNARVNGVEVMNFTTNNFGTPSSSDSTYTLNIGRLGNNIGYTSGQMPLVALFNDDISLTDVQAIEAYWMPQFGIA